MTFHPPSSANRTILLVEDEPFVRDATRRILQNAGFQVLCARDAQEALAVYGRAGENVDLLMTDLVLPGRSGLELAQDPRIRAAATQVLLTSGYGESINQCVESGTHFLAKPYSRHSLLEKIEQIFSGPCFAHAANQAS
jgi:two-component system, cell cycle sensor histidine kinase and response regulator CckA